MDTTMQSRNDVKKYIGITIGPIFETLSDAISPAALRFASAFFSDLTRRLCKKIMAEFPKEGQSGSKDNGSLISPYFDRKDADVFNDRIGKYHDRIFFSVENMEDSDIHERLREIIKSVKCAAAENFNGQKQEKGQDIRECAAFLESYLQIHYIIADEEKLNRQNCILALSPYLDALELMKSFPTTNKGNPFRGLTFGGNDGSRYLKKIAEGSREKDSSDQDRKEDSSDQDRKYRNYYAVVSADADGMGTFLESISEGAGQADENITKFSKRCLDYAEAAAAAIDQYKGMTIYAGGDDLLFLAPVRNGDESIFDLCGKLSAIFHSKIKGEDAEFPEDWIPTVSFGVSVQYYKYPLYEALKRAWDCLDKAKKEPFKDPDAKEADKKKDCIYFHLEKHSGQSTDLLIGNEALDLLKKMLEHRADDEGVDEKTEKTVKSLGAKLQEFREIIRVMDVKWNGKEEHPSWKNLFDNAGQKQGEAFREEVEHWYYEHIVKGHGRIFTIQDGGKNPDLEARQFSSLLAALRISKFFLEKSDENERGTSEDADAV